MTFQIKFHRASTVDITLEIYLNEKNRTSCKNILKKFIICDTKDAIMCYFSGRYYDMQIPSYDIALSYASENYEIVDSVYHYLLGSGFTVFYAIECQHILVGEHQEEVFYKIFSQAARCAVLFVSQHYISKKVPMKEAKICMANRRGYQLIPVYLDGTPLPGLDSSINYFRSDNPEEIVSMITKRITPPETPKQETVEEIRRNKSLPLCNEQNNQLGNNLYISGGNIGQAVQGNVYQNIDTITINHNHS